MTTEQKVTEGSINRPDRNIWPGLTYDDVPGARAWLARLGFAEGILVENETGAVHHSEMLWPEGGRVMLSSRSDPPGEFDSPRGAASVYVVTDHPDTVWDRAEQLSAQVVRPLRDEDYGSRGFSIADAEGNRWSFGTHDG